VAHAFNSNTQGTEFSVSLDLYMVEVTLANRKSFIQARATEEDPILKRKKKERKRERETERQRERKEGRKEGTKEGTKEGRKEGRNEGRKEGDN
jgi:flagellar biosynthesis/type III secretory pathway protein FliH